MNKFLLAMVTIFCFVGFSSMVNANGCNYSLSLNCPPSSDPQVYSNGLDVQLNGGVGADGEFCDEVYRIDFQWGDGLYDSQWFPAAHTYSMVGDYTVTATAYDDPTDGNSLASDTCEVSVDCLTDSDCDDGVFCNGTEMCFEGTCAAVSACPPSIEGCVIRNNSCDEVNDQCVDFLDDSYCAESEMCIASGDCAPVYDCAGFHVPFDKPMAVKRQSKRALPLKFNLFDWYGVEITDLTPAPIVEVRVLGATGSDIAGYDGELLPPGLSDDSNEFEYKLESGQWILNLGMKAYTASTTYEISVIAGDDSYVIYGCTETFSRN